MLRDRNRTLGIACGAISGLLLAVVTSAGILAERVARGEAHVVMVAGAVTAAAAVLLLVTTFRPFIAATGATTPPRPPSRLIAAQAIGAILGVAMVHVALRVWLLEAYPWLCERPAQMVNDLAAIFGALALVWGCTHEPLGSIATLGAVAICAVYAITSPRWHLDAWSAEILHRSWRSISVQIAILVQLAGTAVGVSIFHRRYAREGRFVDGA